MNNSRSEEEVHLSAASKAEDACVLNVNIPSSSESKATGTLPTSTTVSSGQTTPWTGSRSALLGREHVQADADPMEDILLGNLSNVSKLEKNERTLLNRFKHFYYKYIFILNGVTVALAVVLFILVCVLISLHYRMKFYNVFFFF